jgi:hypothetical protein
MSIFPEPDEQPLTKVDALIRLQRARYYLTGYYGGKPDQNDLQAASQIIQPLESQLLEELGSGRLSSLPGRLHGSG